MGNNQNQEFELNITTKEQLLKNLNIVIAKHSSDKKCIEIMQKVYKEKKLNLSVVGLIFKREKTLTSISDAEMMLWCINLFEVTEDKAINPKNYYSDLQIQTVNDFVKKNSIDTTIDEIVLEDVVRKVVKGRTFYHCSFASYYKFYSFSTNSLVRYNFATQRDADLVKIGEEVIQIENVNLNSVDDIADLVEQDEMPPSMITFNVIKSSNNKEFVKYDEATRTLRIKPSRENGFFVDNIDGYHRFLGITKGVKRAENNNIHLDGGMMLLISNYTVDEAENYIHIQNKQNAIKPEHVNSFAKDNYNEFIKELNFEGSSNKNMMYDKICNTMEELKVYENKYTTIGILHAAFELTDLKFDIPFDNEDIYLPHFIGIFNTILGYYFRKYDNDINKIKNETILLEANAFAGYVALGKALLGDDEYKDSLKKFLNSGKLDISKNNDIWNNIDMFKKNPKSYKKIYDYFTKLIK